MVKKLCFIVIIFVVTIISCFKISYADFELEMNRIEDIAFNPDKYNPKSEMENTQIGTKLSSLIGPILGVIQVVGAIVSVLALMLIGIKTMTGSVEEKSQYKEAMPGYLIGIFLVFSMTSIPNIIYKVMK